MREKRVPVEQWSPPVPEEYLERLRERKSSKPKGKAEGKAKAQDDKECQKKQDRDELNTRYFATEPSEEKS